MFNRIFASRGSAKKPDRLWSKCGQHWLLNGSQSVYDVGFECNFLSADQSRLLLIADDRVAREHIEKVVATDSYELTYINGLAKALALLQRKQFKIIVLDLNLPDSKGASTFDAVKESSGDTPIIIFTGTDDEDLARDLIGRGAHDYLVNGKCNPETIASVIERALAPQQPQKAQQEDHAQRGISDDNLSDEAGDEEPIIDPEVAMQHVEGDEDLIREMVGIFFEECSDMIDKIQSGINAGDADLVERAAHTLKSSSAMFGARRARAAASELELSGKAGDISKAPQQLDRLQQEFELLRRAVDEQWGTGAS